MESANVDTGGRRGSRRPAPPSRRLSTTTPPISPRPAFLVSRHRWGTWRCHRDVDAAQVEIDVVWHVVDVAWLMLRVVDVVWGA